MAKLKPYTITEAQQLLDNAITRSRPRHDEWNLLEHLYASGTTDGLVANATAAGVDMSRIIQETTGVPLDVVNMVLPHINMIVASTVARDPSFIVEPISGGQAAEDYAVICEAVVKYFWKRSNATSDLYDATKDFVVCGNGFLKVGWRYTEKTTRRTDEEIDAEVAALMDAAIELANEQGTVPPSLEELRGMVSVTTVDVVADEPYVEYVRPYDIYVPSDARRLWESRWVAQRIVKPADEVRAQLGLSTEHPLTLMNAWQQESRSQWRNESQRDPFQFAEIFEFYDMRTRRLMIFQRGADEPLYEGDLPYGHRHPPFVHLANFRRNPSEFWAFGDLKNIAGLQSMLNETFQEQMENMRRAGNKVLISEELVTPDVEDALQSPDTNLAIKVRLPDGSPMQDKVMALPAQPLPSDVYTASDALQSGMAQVLGLSDFQRGLSGADRMSGTAAAAVEGATTLRAADKIQAIETGAAHVGELILLLSQEFLSEETAVRVVGSRGALWVQVPREVVQGEYIVQVEGGSMKALNPATRQQRAMDRANMLLPMLQANGYDPEPLLRSIVRDLGEDPDVVLRKVEPPVEEAPAAGMPMEEAPPMEAPMPEPAAGDPLMDLVNMVAAEPTPVDGPQTDFDAALANQMSGGVSL